MEKKEFHLGDVLSITTGRLVSSRHIDGVYDILNFMTGDNLFTHQLPRASRECEPYLLMQFPQLATPEMDAAVAKLDKELRNLDVVPSHRRNDKAKEIVSKWLAEQIAVYGETLSVEPLPKGFIHEVKNPIDELENMMNSHHKN